MSIKATEEAIEEIKNRYRSLDRGFRIMINGFGWGGPVFGIAQDEQTEEDYVEMIEGVKFYVHEDLKDQFGLFTVDFMSNFFRKSFIVSASNSSSC